MRRLPYPVRLTTNPGCEAQRQLPFLFAGSAMASAGAVGLAATALGADREPAARLAAVRVCDDVEAPAELRVAVVDGTPRSRRG